MKIKYHGRKSAVGEILIVENLLKGNLLERNQLGENHLKENLSERNQLGENHLKEILSEKNHLERNYLEEEDKYYSKFLTIFFTNTKCFSMPFCNTIFFYCV